MHQFIDKGDQDFEYFIDFKAGMAFLWFILPFVFAIFLTFIFLCWYKMTFCNTEEGRHFIIPYILL